jgi:hypothetical protein
MSDKFEYKYLYIEDIPPQYTPPKQDKNEEKTLEIIQIFGRDEEDN